MIGFLVDCGVKIEELKAESERENSTKKEFKQYLKDRIRHRVNCQLDELYYGEPVVKKLLLLFNIQTLLSTREADIRFPFDRYKQEKWDIEHIRSQTNSFPVGAARQEWLKDIEVYFRGSRFKGESLEKEQKFADLATKLLTLERIDDEFSRFYNDVVNYFGQNEVSWVNELGNLALLDSSTNRSYKNALFPIKRARIIDNDKRGIFVPICTKNVFLKYYSQSVIELIHWSESDAKDYHKAIGQTLKEYLPEQGKKNE